MRVLCYVLLTVTGLTPGGSSTVRYTFTHKQHNDTEYTEQNTVTIREHKHNNKNT